MQSSLVADVRAVTYWGMVEPEWDGVTLPRPKAVHAPLRYEIQIRRVIVTADGQPGLSDWEAIPNFDIEEKPPTAKDAVLIVKDSE